MLHLRPIRLGARNVRDDTGPKEAWRSDPLYAPPSVAAVFAKAKLVHIPGRSGLRLAKVRSSKTTKPE